MTTRAYDYVAYIDEAGDTGLQRVRPIDPLGSSEWFILSAVVIRAEEEANVQAWVQDIVKRVGSGQRTDVHFSQLLPHRKMLAASALSQLRVRYRASCSSA